MAAPLVSSVAAVVTSAARSATVSDRVNALTATATDKGAPGRDDAYGFGAVNPVAALQRLGVTPAGGPSPSPTPSVTRVAPRVSLAAPSTVPYGAPIRVTGVVTDGATGVPVAGAKLRVDVAQGTTTWSAPVTADAAGRYSFTATMRRTVAVRAAFAGSATVLPGTTRWRTVSMVPSVSTSLRRGVMRVQVTPASTGSLLTLVKRSSSRWVVVARTRTDAAGRASFRIVSSGTYRVRLGR